MSPWNSQSRLLAVVSHPIVDVFGRLALCLVKPLEKALGGCTVDIREFEEGRGHLSGAVADDFEIFHNSPHRLQDERDHHHQHNDGDRGHADVDDRRADEISSPASSYRQVFVFGDFWTDAWYHAR